MRDALAFATFIVRLMRDRSGALTGTVTRVRSGEQRRFEGVEAISPLIARMVDDPPQQRREP